MDASIIYSSAKVPLHLELHVPPKEVEELFTLLLNTQRNSLRKLILFEQRTPHFRYRRMIGHLPTDQDFILVLPDKMEQLEHLQLSKNYKTWMVPIKPVEYARQTPNLKTLSLIGKDGFRCIYNYFGVPSVNTCALTNFDSHDQASDPKIGVILSQMFPNLTKLSIRYPSSQLLVVLWSSCTNVKDLTLNLRDTLDCPYMDDAMTGLEPRVIDYYLQRTKQKQPHGQIKTLKEFGNKRKIACSILKLTGTICICMLFYYHYYKLF